MSPPSHDILPDAADTDGILRRLHDEIAERQRLERTLEESEEKYRKLTEHAKAGICIVQDTVLVYINPRLSEIFGYASQEMLGRSFIEFVSPEALPGVEESYRRFNQEKVFDQRYETVIVHKGGAGIAVEVNLTMTHYRHQRAALALIYDISDRKAAQTRIHLLTQQLLRAHEDERAHLSRELHDRVAQDLSSLKIGCDTLFDDHSEIPPSVRERATALSDLLRQCIHTVRTMAYTLRPPGLERFGLVRSLRLYCEDFESRTGIRVDFSAAGMDPLALDEDQNINLFRVVQEALRNIDGHADARTVTVRLVASSPKILLRIHDDGRGFDVAARRESARAEKRMGLLSMEERVALLGGRLKIRSRPETGTRLSIEVPYGEKHRAR